MSLFGFGKKKTVVPSEPKPLRIYYTILRTQGNEAEITRISTSSSGNTIPGWMVIPDHADPGTFNEYVRGHGHAEGGGEKSSCKIVSIAYNALSAGCSSHNLLGIVIPETVREIGAHAFWQAGTKILVPDSLQAIGNDAFISSSEKKPSLDLAANYYEGAYYLGNERNPYVLLLRVDYNATACTIHPDTKILHDHAFNRWSNGSQLTIPAKVRFIGEPGNMYNIRVTFEDPYGWWTLDNNSFDASYYGKIDMARGIKSNGMRKQ